MLSKNNMTFLATKNPLTTNRLVDFFEEDMMTKKELKQYRALRKEYEYLGKSIEKLYDRLDNVNMVISKVKSSMSEHPYIETHETIEAPDPETAEAIRKRIIIRLTRSAIVSELIIKIENYILDIEDSEDRQIFDLVFIQGLKLEEVGGIVGMDRSSVGKRISRRLESDGK